MPMAYLADRGVVRVAGEGAKAFLDGLLTCDLDRVAPGRPRFGALLSPQGKILFDFFVFEGADGIYLDCARETAEALAKRLGFYRLRAKVTIEDLSETLGVVAGWDDTHMPGQESGLAARDPRLSALGWRAIIAQAMAAEFGWAGAEAYHVHRITLGAPEAGKDFSFNDAFPHEALMDQLHGIDFDKGCYVGQEVVSRMQHRGTARTRIVSIIYLEGFAPPAGTEVIAGDRGLGRTGSGAGRHGLAMLRLDRVADALAAGETLRVSGVPIRLEKPAWVTFPFPDEAPTPAV